MSEAPRELTLRALLTGLLLGALLTPSNVYSGLKIGWSFNMSIIALLVGFAFWQSLGRALRLPAWSLHESNINQTAASSAASIISSGLVAPIPAYTLITGQQLDTLPLMAWVFSVSFLGIWVAWYLRPSLIVEGGLRFPEGMATLATMQQIYSHGAEATRRLLVLSAAALLAALSKLVDSLLWSLPRWAPGAQLERLTFSLEPSLLLLGFGGIIGLRVGLSLMLGAVLAWGLLSPWLIAEGLVVMPADASGPQFALLIEWLLWPGVSLMVCATLTSLGLRMLRARREQSTRPLKPARPNAVPLFGLTLAAVLVVIMQMTLFDIHPFMAALSIPLAVLLAMVAARVVGSTGIPPIGAIGQLSQLSFGVIAPGQVAINLMSANTAGGAAGQCTDLLNDFKVGHAIGAAPSRQAVAQCFGILVGSLVGVVVYQLLIPDPQAMLITTEWPAPAVATWKAVAEALTAGLGSIGTDIRWAMVAGALTGIGLGALEGLLPMARLRWLPSSAALGLAFIIPASISLMMAFGALLAWLFAARWGGLAERFVIVAAAGLVAGESMAGVGISLWQLLR
ncbi:peptide transporter [Stutzerimonas stutzeri]|uniref:Peptide transporter n=1 Tax=Stutzerimonas stutzeri TaxID=316 RepID=W8QU99_STUST|nr:OPT family oligopeptide transporter [Stutzerimonas stutzeri]AHL73859.1 peptide transporter [Stutzerimonas stutzeri]MCQ4328619.1 OPT/YSL family transporter [Stutzerimonas stutzeri]